MYLNSPVVSWSETNCPVSSELLDAPPSPISAAFVGVFLETAWLASLYGLRRKDDTKPTLPRSAPHNVDHKKYCLELTRRTEVLVLWDCIKFNYGSIGKGTLVSIE